MENRLYMEYRAQNLLAYLKEISYGDNWWEVNWRCCNLATPPFLYLFYKYHLK
jgi:hypothetical protein